MNDEDLKGRLRCLMHEASPTERVQSMQQQMQSHASPMINSMRDAVGLPKIDPASTATSQDADKKRIVDEYRKILDQVEAEEEFKDWKAAGKFVL